MVRIEGSSRPPPPALGTHAAPLAPPPPPPLARTMRTYLLLSDLSYCPRLLLLLDNERLRLDCGRLLQDDRLSIGCE
jgi:hypothetical protein